MASFDRESLLQSAQKALAKQQYDKAQKDYEAILAHDKKDVQALTHLAEIYQRTNSGERAAECYLELAKLYKAQGFLPKVVASLRHAAQLFPDRPEVFVRLGDALKEQGHKLEAAAQYLVAADSYEQHGDLVALLDALQRMVEADSENAMARARLGETYAAQNMKKEASEQLRWAASALLAQKREAEYVKVVERISFLEPLDFEVLRELGRLYLKAGDAAHAVKKLKGCFKLQPEDVETLTLLAEAFRQQGDGERAVAVLRPLVRALLDKDERDKARKALKVLLELKPGDPEAEAQMLVL